MSDELDRVEELRNANKRPTSEDTERYNNLEKDIKKREQYQSFLSHPVTKEIVEKMIAWIKDWNAQLIAGKGDANMVARRDNLIDILSIFSPSKAKTDHLVKDIPNEIKEFEKYYGGYPGV